MASPTLANKLLGLGVIAFLATAGTFAGLFLPFAPVDDLESRTWDFRVSFAAKNLAPDPNIKLVVIDQRSLDLAAAEQDVFWVWPRDFYEPVIRYLRKAGVRGIAFDMLFSEQSSYGVKVDESFGGAIAGTPPVVLAAFPQIGQQHFNQEALERFHEIQDRRSNADKIGSRFLSHPTIGRFGNAIVPTAEIMRAAEHIGSVAGKADPDGVFRHTVPGMFVNGSPILNLPFALYGATSGGEDPAEWLSEFLDPAGKLAVRFKGGRRPYTMYSIYAVIQSFIREEQGEAPIIPLDEFKDAYVFIGGTAPGLLDLRSNPVSADASGVEFNAAVLDNILHRDFARKVPSWLAGVLSALAIVSMAALTVFTQEVRTHALIFVTYAVTFLGTMVMSALYGWWFPMVAPAIGLTLAALASNGFQFYLEGRQHRFIKDAFKQYVSPSVIDKIVADPSALSLGGERRELTMFFSDIQGFTSISETLEAEKLVAMINKYLTAMTRVVLEHGGTVDKYVGDAIVAFWNAPLRQEDHALRAVRAALDCQRRLSELRPEFEREFGVGVWTRIGLNTGVVGVGNFGSEERFNYTMIGDAANLASRLEGANKAFGTFIMISETTMTALRGQVPCRKLASLRVVGKDEVVPVYEPLDPKDPSAVGVRESFERALELYEKGKLIEAEAAFREIPSDPVTTKYLYRIEKEQTLGGSSNSDWSPVWNLSEK
jgi:adenylate cyclase